MLQLGYGSMDSQLHIKKKKSVFISSSSSAVISTGDYQVEGLRVRRFLLQQQEVDHSYCCLSVQAQQYSVDSRYYPLTYGSPSDFRVIEPGSVSVAKSLLYLRASYASPLRSS